MRDNELDMRGFILHELVPYLAARGVPVSGGSVRAPWHGIDDAAERAAYRDILDDSGFFGMASLRYSWMVVNVQEYATAERFALDVLKLLEDQYPGLGGR